MMDAKAKKILLSTYWKNGWIDRPLDNLSKRDFEYAKEHQLMFNNLDYIHHNDCLSQIIEFRDKLNSEILGKAFLSSLSSRRLDLRSALASYHIAKQLEEHLYDPVVSGQSYENGEVIHTSYTCKVCRDAQYGIIGNEEYQNVDLNVLNFERIKWGGVRHGQLVYTLLDLKLFCQQDIPEPSQEDVNILKEILNSISNSEANDYPSALERRLKDVVKSSANEREALIEILACIGVLEPKSYDRPIRGKSDWVYATYWRGEDGYNDAVIKEYFGKYITI